MMFALSKNLYEGQVETKKGNWEIRGAHKAFELEGKTVGVIGLGAIGRETAKICQGVGMKVAGYDPFMSQDKIEALGAEYYADYKGAAEGGGDIVTVHVPLTEQTRDMIGAAELATMKKTALVINCSRGGIVNEADLCAAFGQAPLPEPAPTCSAMSRPSRTTAAEHPPQPDRQPPLRRTDPRSRH